MNDILDVAEPPEFSEDITRYQWHTFNPFISSGNYENNDEIRIAINSPDLQTHPEKSLLILQVSIVSDANADDSAKTQLINNALPYLFSEIRYELNSVTVSSVRQLGIATTIKALISMDPLYAKAMSNACWLENPDETKSVKGRHIFLVPLKHLLGFAEDYKKVIINMKQELILVRSQSDTDAFFRKEASDATFQFKLEKVSWRLPIVELDDSSRLRYLEILERNTPIAMPFRSWELFFYPQLPQTDKQSWSVKLSTAMEKPRFVILAFQTNRRNNMERSSSVFDHCNIRNVKLFLSGQTYPAEDMDINFDANGYATLYQMYTEFQVTYYNKANPEPLLTFEQFKNHCPLIVIDCSRQKDAIKSGSIDVRLEFTARENFPSNTCAYALIIADKLVQYTPSDGAVRHII